jgi:hypothetical protein
VRTAKPPSLATWLLQHLSPGSRNEALAGDLIEEFRAGRSHGWYWRQVLSAIAIESSRQLVSHRTVLAFAALWSMLAPAWLLAVSHAEQHFHFAERISGFDWLWFSVSDLGLLLAANLVFIWAGIALYLTPHLWLSGSLRLRKIGRGILVSLPVVALLWAALILLPKRYVLLHQHVDRPSLSSFSGPPVPPLPHATIQQLSRNVGGPATADDKVAPSPNPRPAASDTRSSAILACLPFFLCVLCSLWAATSSSNRSGKRISA